MKGPDYTGIVANFHMEDKVDGDGVRYFEFALTVHPLPPPPTPPAEIVFYINPKRDFAAQCAGQAFVSWGRQSPVEVYLDHNDPAKMRVRDVRPLTGHFGIPPDPYPHGQSGTIYAGQTSFDRQMGGAHVRFAELRGASGLDVVSFQVTVIPPVGKRPLPLSEIRFGEANPGEPQIVVGIQSPDSSAIADGYMCHFSFVSRDRPKKA